jgi:hypothetical protein
MNRGSTLVCSVRGGVGHATRYAPPIERFDMGLLDKKNPKATASSVLKHAVVTAAVGAVVFFLFFKSSYREAWPVTLPIWLLLCAGVGALWKWQVPDG